MLLFRFQRFGTGVNVKLSGPLPGDAPETPDFCRSGTDARLDPSDLTIHGGVFAVGGDGMRADPVVGAPCFKISLNLKLGGAWALWISSNLSLKH